MRLRPSVSACVLLAVTAAGCGGSSAKPDEASKSPRQILADVQRDLAKVRSYHVTGTETDTDAGRSSVVGDVDASGSLRFTLRQSGHTAQFIVINTDSYLRGDQSFWRDQAGIKSSRLTRALANRWVKIPTAESGSLARQFDQFTPRELAHCMTAASGTVTKSGTARFSGEPVVILTDKGDRPGTNPGRLYVTTSDRALPVREVVTGRQRPGGHRDARCSGSGDATTTHSDVRLSGFDRHVNIVAPPNPLNFDQLNPDAIGAA
jgi:hypothetical protein